MNKENMNTTPETFDNDEYMGFILQAFDHAVNVMLSGELEVKQTAEAMTQAARAAVGSPYGWMCNGFLLGLYEGMQIR